ncbi:MAG: hypothetical protein M3Y34_08020, partial [Actinomycetota bacterium]|nr:hypothetical protein [Actinomycetota bacterium]
IYMGRRPGSAPETAWGYSPVVSWPIAGDAADEIASVAAGDPHNTLSDRARLEGLLGLARPAAPAAKPAVPKKATTPAVIETFVERAVRWARRVNIPILLQGPAGSGKTQALVEARDGMPVYRTSMTAEADVATAIGDLARSASGEWVPRLGRISAVVRYAMLAAIAVALGRGRRLSHADADAFTSSESAREVWWALEALAANPGDRVSRAVLDERAWPYDPDSWAPVLHAYVATEAYSVGTVASLFLDEIHDAANANPSFQTVLKLALEGERLFLTEVAGAGWAPMYCHNVAFAAAGNPDEHGQFGRALRSRFGLAVGVGYAPREQSMRWHESRFGPGTPAVPRVALTAARPWTLAEAAFEPPEPKPSAGLSTKEIGAVVDFGLWTREENRAGRLADGLETRGEAQVLQVMRFLRDEEPLAPREAFASAASLVVDRLCLLDDLGLPDHDQRESAIQKIEEIARRF